MNVRVGSRIGDWQEDVRVTNGTVSVLASHNSTGVPKVAQGVAGVVQLRRMTMPDQYPVEEAGASQPTAKTLFETKY